VNNRKRNFFDAVCEDKKNWYISHIDKHQGNLRMGGRLHFSLANPNKDCRFAQRTMRKLMVAMRRTDASL